VYGGSAGMMNYLKLILPAIFVVFIFALQTISMKLIADSGSTKTTWALLDKGKIISVFNTSGFNPYYFGSNDISLMLQNEFAESLPFGLINELVYYGSGCSTEVNCMTVSDALQVFFHNAQITIHHDMLGAAHALLGHSAGIACILGTGSNSCLYDGHRILSQVPSLGYLLGDEGSGYHIGRKLLAAMLNGTAPADISNSFAEQYKLNLSAVLHRIYKEEKPGPFIASFAEFAAQHIDHPWCNALVTSCFDDFIKLMLRHYVNTDKLPFSFTGSVAYHFRELLTGLLHSKGLSTGRFLSSPMEGLIEYHTSWVS
jgi:N-acetylglucosamine kinase-like BadF-type ATPase